VQPNPGANCDDGNSCTTGEKCQGTTCSGGAPVTCDDCLENASCDRTTGACRGTPKADGTPCVGGGTCQGGTCKPQVDAGAGGSAGASGAGGSAGASGAGGATGGASGASGAGGTTDSGTTGGAGQSGSGGTGTAGGAGQGGASGAAGGGEGGTAGTPTIDGGDTEPTFVRKPGGCSCDMSAASGIARGAPLALLVLATKWRRRRRATAP
jgi:MYXO-CTERM domain-containing protein